MTYAMILSEGKRQKPPVLKNCWRMNMREALRSCFKSVVGVSVLSFLVASSLV